MPTCPHACTQVTREEIRRLPAAKQERAARAFLRMMHDLDDGIPGTSQYFKLAVVHGGMPGLLPASDYPEYCAHRRECFPGWHRAYIAAFEQSFRRADMICQEEQGQSGGELGLPYWDWTSYSVVGTDGGVGECFPRIVREKLLVDFTAIPGVNRRACHAHPPSPALVHHPGPPLTHASPRRTLISHPHPSPLTLTLTLTSSVAAPPPSAWRPMAEARTGAPPALPTPSHQADSFAG